MGLVVGGAGVGVKGVLRVFVCVLVEGRRREGKKEKGEKSVEESNMTKLKEKKGEGLDSSKRRWRTISHQNMNLISPTGGVHPSVFFFLLFCPSEH